MKNLLKLDSFALFVLSLLLYHVVGFSWWIFLACFFLPDLGMLGYLINTRVGAASYNLLHHLGLPIICISLGALIAHPALLAAGIILLSHSAFDRTMGYGLKYPDAFKHTHLD
jgi:hypothetical protein